MELIQFSNTYLHIQTSIAYLDVKKNTKICRVGEVLLWSQFSAYVIFNKARVPMYCIFTTEQFVMQCWTHFMEWRNNFEIVFPTMNCTQNNEFINKHFHQFQDFSCLSAVWCAESVGVTQSLLDFIGSTRISIECQKRKYNESTEWSDYLWLKAIGWNSHFFLTPMWTRIRSLNRLRTQ